MLRILFFLGFLLLASSLTPQTIEEVYPKTLWCPNDTFVLKFSNYPKFFPYSVSKATGSSPGTDAAIGLYVTIYYGKDSVRFFYHNSVPYAHLLFIPFASPAGKTTLRIHLNEFSCHFPAGYVDTHKGQIQFGIPEAYELANILWALSPSGQRASDLNTQGAYYQAVRRHFEPYLGHPVFQQLNVPDSLYAKTYYDFRENSFAFNFKDPRPDSTRLLFNGPYYYVYGDELADSSLFGKLKPLVEDFAAVSGFREFYQSQLGFYAKEIQRQKDLMPVRAMWSWLETQFPGSKHDAYRIVFSPLIGGSHSTQNYQENGFKETVMFVCGPERVDADQQLSEKQKEGLLSGIVFTEIDHNHVNPETRKHRALVDSIFSRRSTWVKPGNYRDYYPGSQHVFNEYMTHAVFCLYCLDHYDAATAGFIIQKREALMDRRNFIRFREFNAELMHLRRQHPEMKVEALYPLILKWCQQQA